MNPEDWLTRTTAPVTDLRARMEDERVMTGQFYNWLEEVKAGEGTFPWRGEWTKDEKKDLNVELRLGLSLPNLDMDWFNSLSVKAQARVKENRERAKGLIAILTNHVYAATSFWKMRDIIDAEGFDDDHEIHEPMADTFYLMKKQMAIIVHEMSMLGAQMLEIARKDKGMRIATPGSIVTDEERQEIQRERENQLKAEQLKATKNLSSIIRGQQQQRRTYSPYGDRRGRGRGRNGGYSGRNGGRGQRNGQGRGRGAGRGGPSGAQNNS